MNPEPNETVPGKPLQNRPILLDGGSATLNPLQYAAQATGWAAIGLAAGLWGDDRLNAAWALTFGAISIAYGLRNLKFVKPLVTYSREKAAAYREAKRAHPTYERAELQAVALALMENPEMVPYYGGGGRRSFITTDSEPRQEAIAGSGAVDDPFRIVVDSE
jgi:hypothetical protein